RVFDDLRQAAAKFAVGKRPQQVGIGYHQTRRIESTDEILALRKVHTGLSADGAVHLRNQSRGDVKESYTAQIRSCRKTSDVADDAAANCDYQRFAIRSGAAQRARDMLYTAKMLRGLRIVEEMHTSSIGKPQAAMNNFPSRAPNLG